MEEHTSRERILEAARKRIQRDGILGLRVADVAKDAETSITLIYKYYVDRDTLLAHVLGDMYQEFRNAQMQRIDTWMDSQSSITLEEFAAITPNPEIESKDERDFRLQMLATALENTGLRDRIAQTTNDYYTWVLDRIERARAKLPEEDRHFDAQFITVIMFNMMFVFYDLLENKPTTVDMYRKLILNQLRSSSRSISS